MTRSDGPSGRGAEGPSIGPGPGLTPRPIRSRFIALLLGTLAPAASSCGGAQDSTPPLEVVDDSVSLEEIRAVVETVGTLELFNRVSAPSPVLTDLFGIQPLQPFTFDGIVDALVPGHAREIERTERALTLDLLDGPTVTFRHATRLVFNGAPVDRPYARIVLDSAASYPAEPEAFRRVLRDAGVGESFLLDNPHWTLEERVTTIMADPSQLAPAEVAADSSGFGATQHAALLVSDTHGPTEPYDHARALLELPEVEWLAVEMMSERLQPQVDDFLASPTGSATYEEARAALLAYYLSAWNSRGHEVTDDPADNPYFRMIDRARGLGKHVYALDADVEYILFRFGEFPLGSTVRDAVWASRIPPSGRGVVYGGGAHFSPSRHPNMLAFLHERFPEMGLFRSAPR